MWVSTFLFRHPFFVGKGMWKSNVTGIIGDCNVSCILWKCSASLFGMAAISLSSCPLQFPSLICWYMWTNRSHHNYHRMSGNRSATSYWQNLAVLAFILGKRGRLLFRQEFETVLGVRALRCHASSKATFDLDPSEWDAWSLGWRSSTSHCRKAELLAPTCPLRYLQCHLASASPARWQLAIYATYSVIWQLSLELVVAKTFIPQLWKVF